MMITYWRLGPGRSTLLRGALDPWTVVTMTLVIIVIVPSVASMTPSVKQIGINEWFVFE